MAVTDGRTDDLLNHLREEESSVEYVGLLRGAGQANQADTIGFATRQNVLWRSARNSVGSLIANVGNLQPGDTILLVYRHGRPHVARVTAKIAEVTRPVPGTAVIERIEPPYSQYFLDAGFRQVDDNGAVEVIHLEDVTECEIVLQGAYAGMGTIHRLAPEDTNVVALLPGSEPDTEPEEHSAPADVAPAVVPVQGQAPFGPNRTVRRAGDRRS